MRRVVAVMIALAFALPAVAQEVTETGVKFQTQLGDLQLLGTGLRTKTFLKVKVYAVGLYADPAGLAAHKGKAVSPLLYKDLVWGDSRREIHMKFIRGEVSASQIQEAFRESLANANKARVEAFLTYFGDTKAGQEYVLHWVPGGTLETTVAGQAKPPIADKDFASAVFGIWLGDKPIQDDIKKGLVSRAAEVLK